MFTVFDLGVADDVGNTELSDKVDGCVSGLLGVPMDFLDPDVKEDVTDRGVLRFEASLCIEA